MRKVIISLIYANYLFLVGCGGSTGSQSSSSMNETDETLSENLANQAPQIKCDVKVGNTIFRTIDTRSSAEVFIQNFKAGDLVTFDCSQTSDEDRIENLKFEIDTQHIVQAPNYRKQTSYVFDYLLQQDGQTPMSIKVTDSKGLSRFKNFTLAIACRNVETPSLGANAISVQATSKLNYFNFSIDTSKVSGGQNFQYSWDFNGDGVYDQTIVNNLGSLWTPLSFVPNIYTIFATQGSQTRNINLLIKNRCGGVREFKNIPVKTEMINIERTASSLAVEKPYYYIQADVRHTSNSMNQRRNGDILLTQYPEETHKKVSCEYQRKRLSQRGTFVLKGIHSNINSTLYHQGLEIQIENIEENLNSIGSFQTISNPHLATSTYKASAQLDGLFASEVFSKDSECTVSLRIKRVTAVEPCANTTHADFREKSAIIFVGEYSCPNLRNRNTGDLVSVQNGKFFCEVGPVNQCVGGGGGGGGAPPPQE